ncbi:Signal transduction histidine kinase [Amycolatopsis marina]|uniref:histidine kinase n=1 Tax=Amycolatopsis marina TaxID=490629 RepID=A0A1I1B662_9PSEU|nr:sensor histidine kinase [Amycolatopsis marina]SFB45557.1 Signal transduction histidine kinase [Amycolatopsis marina]
MCGVLRWNDLARLRVHRLDPVHQDRVIALATLAFGSVLYLVGLYPLFADPATGAPLWTRVVVLALLCTLQLWRRRAPALALGAGTAVMTVDMLLGFSAPALISYSDLIYAATLYGSARLSRAMIPTAAVGVIAATATAMLTFPDWRVAVVAACACLPFLVIPVWWATNIRQQRDIAENERAAADAAGRIAELDRAAALAAERARMARDLHDAIAGHLSAIAIQSSAALSVDGSGNGNGPGQDDTIHSVLTSVRENSVRALEEMRAMIGLLSDPASASAETVAPARLAQLSTLVESARTSGMELDLRSELDDTGSLPTAVDLAAYRIIQEALTNVLKHAPGRRATVWLRCGEGTLTVEVRNDLPAERHSGTGLGRGLDNMHERAIAVGGSFTAAPSGSNWLVRAVLPTTQAPAAASESEVAR